MNKLLLLVILGLALGAGVWKVQNPDGTLDDAKSQGIAVVDRFKVGVDAVINQPAVASEETSLGVRLTELEERVDADENVADAQTLQGAPGEQTDAPVANLQEAEETRVASMESMNMAVAELDTALQDTRARTDAGNVRLDAIDRRLGLLVRRLDEENADADVETLDETVTNVLGQVDELQTELEARNRAITDELAGIRENSDNLALRLETLVTSANNAEGQESEGAENESLLAMSAGIDERIDGIESRLETVNTDSRRIATLSDQLEAARERIAELEQQDAQASESIEELSNSVENLATAGETTSIESIQTQIKDQLAVAQAQFDNSSESTDTAELETLLESTRGRIQALEQRVQELPASSDKTDDALEIQSALQAQIAELTQRLENMTNTDPALVSTVDDVKQQVEKLSAQGFVTRDELQAQIDPEAIEYKIYFDRNSTEISDEAAVVLDSFITQEKNRTTGVSIFGFTDRSGSAAYNQQLAIQRATIVRSYLIQNGLDFTKIKALSGLGEDAAAAVLPDNAASAQQRVVVVYAAQP